MPKLCVHNFCMSLDGYAAGPDQTVDEPLAGFEGIGATIMGRNMFGPVRGEWSDVNGEPWTGWWGPNPPYHHPVFVLTHHAREPVEMEGGTTFHFVTDGIERGEMNAIADGYECREYIPTSAVAHMIVARAST